MPAATPRKFSLADAMVLVAATAFGLFLVRRTFPEWSDIRSSLRTANSGMKTFLVIQEASQAVVPLLAAWPRTPQG